MGRGKCFVVDYVCAATNQINKHQKQTYLTVWFHRICKWHQGSHVINSSFSRELWNTDTRGHEQVTSGFWYLLNSCQASFSQEEFLLYSLFLSALAAQKCYGYRTYGCGVHLQYILSPHIEVRQDGFFFAQIVSNGRFVVQIDEHIVILEWRISLSVDQLEL